MSKKIITTLLAVATLLAAKAQSVVYVDKDATNGQGDGTSWADAYQSLNIAIQNCSGGEHIWVAEGNYREYFTIDRSVQVFGGFSGTETSELQADPENNPVIFDADINGDDIPGDFMNNKSDNFNYLCAVQPYQGLEFSASLHGITFMNAYSSSAGAAIDIRNTAGVPYVIIEIIDCKFLFNSTSGLAGSAVAVEGVNGVVKAKIDKCVFAGNVARGTSRGTLFIYGFNALGSAVVSNCLFLDNIDPNTDFPCVIYNAVSSAAVGGNGTSTATIINNTIISDGDYAVFYWNGSTDNTCFLNSEFANNIVNAGAASLFIGTTATNGNVYSVNAHHNLWDVTPLINVSGPVTTNNMVNPNPGFTNPLNDDYSLQSNSPCINAGDTTGLDPYYDGFDLAGNSRFNGTVDFGAFESTGITGVSETQFESMQLYPNPAKGILNIQANGPSNLNILNVWGEACAVHKLGPGKNSLDISGLRPGIYFAQTENGIAAKFVKE